jgi:FAD-dependent urate hydroxylase
VHENLGMGEIIETYGGPMHFLAYKEYQAEKP